MSEFTFFSVIAESKQKIDSTCKYEKLKIHFTNDDRQNFRKPNVNKKIDQLQIGRETKKKVHTLWIKKTKKLKNHETHEHVQYSHVSYDTLESSLVLVYVLTFLLSVLVVKLLPTSNIVHQTSNVFI